MIIVSRTAPSVIVDADELMTRPAAISPTFHSEADFQHALAWQIQLSHPGPKFASNIGRLGAVRPHIDIWLASGGTYLALELKYRTRQLDVDWEGETYELLSHSVQDVGRYDFVRDVRRLELVTDGRPDVSGMAVILTNDSVLWNEPRARISADSSFRIHEGRVLSGMLEWGETAGPGTRKGRE